MNARDRRRVRRINERDRKAQPRFAAQITLNKDEIRRAAARWRGAFTEMFGYYYKIGGT